MSGKNPQSIHGRLAQQAQLYWLHLSGIFLLSLLSSPFALLGPLPLKIAVDSVLDQRPLPRVLQAWGTQACKNRGKVRWCSTQYPATLQGSGRRRATGE